ncbi:MJ0570-related uncharacterized domain-containing protein [Salinibacillus kushneri]|uniref:MJ0570-related uncharacterized domain-containing protein n=1 Tax=Salinibacillus kushneri TaxID=237682 RepID=A0A1I0IQT9_9BACI|nr:adenine nucleotide alpha hydrolase [Salinibacillus kushneri]SET99543.1 MJ0570-related uncharacterized domain-containing protein [Salinibacillus kushneri]
MKKRIAVSFSGGKDSILALNRLIQSKEWDVVCLVTTITEEYNRTTMHGVRETLLDEQAYALNFPLYKVYIPPNCTNQMYENVMDHMIQQLIQDGITHMMFGDIHLEDVKRYREKMLEDTAIQPLFPIWGEQTQVLFDEFLNEGFQTIITCVDSTQLSPQFTGRLLDNKFLKAIPETVDPCGENGEFHTFVFDGPLFHQKVNFNVVRDVTIRKDMYTGKDRFFYVDLQPI